MPEAGLGTGGLDWPMIDKELGAGVKTGAGLLGCPVRMRFALLLAPTFPATSVALYKVGTGGVWAAAVELAPAGVTVTQVPLIEPLEVLPSKPAGRTVTELAGRAARLPIGSLLKIIKYKIIPINFKKGKWTYPVT